DADAAGYGWFVDPTPADDSEFAVPTAFGLGAGAGSPAAGRMDLLTVVMHELGHVIGLDSHSGGDPADLMAAYLGTGDRRRPSAGEAAGAGTLLVAGPVSVPESAGGGERPAEPNRGRPARDTTPGQDG